MGKDATYNNADGKFWKGLFMPHTILTDKSKEKKAKEVQNAKLIAAGAERVKEQDAKSKSQQKMMMYGIGSIVIVGLGVGLYYAFKK